MNIRKLKLPLAFVLLAVIFVSGAKAQKSFLQGNLQFGSHSVGFKIIYKYDYSRSWNSKYDAEEQLVSGNVGRPIRISVWYPSQKKTAARKVLYQDYVFYKTNDKIFAQANKMLEERDVQSLRHILKNSEPVFNKLMAAPMAAYLNAAPVKGRFPLLIYSSGLNDISSSNVVLWEYLASHGYVVITVPQLGTTSESVNLGIDPIDLETQTRDLEFALGVAHDFPSVAADKLAVMGHSMGGVSSLILQMRNTEVDAVIGLDASYGTKSLIGTLTQSPYYQAEKMRVPFLDMRRPHEEVDLNAINSFKYSERYFLGFPEIFHGDFTSFPMIALKFPTDIQDRTPEIAGRGYQNVCRYALNFLNAYLKKDEKGLKFISNHPETNGIPAGVVIYEFHKGLQAPPSEQEFVQIIERYGLPKAIETFRRFKTQEPQLAIIRQNVLNSLGYALIGRKQMSLAIDVFRLNVAAHPASANAYDSLAEGYQLNGDKNQALKNYEKVLELLPNDPNVNEAQKNNLRQTALQKLRELKRQ